MISSLKKNFVFIGGLYCLTIAGVIHAQSISDFELKQFQPKMEEHKLSKSTFDKFSMELQTAHLLNNQEPDSARAIYLSLMSQSKQWKLTELEIRLKLDLAFQSVRNGNVELGQINLDETKEYVLKSNNKFLLFCYHRISSHALKIYGQINDALEAALIAKKALVECIDAEKNETQLAIYSLSLVNIQSDIGNLYKDAQQMDKSISILKENLKLILEWDAPFLERVEKNQNYKDLNLANVYNNLGLTMVSNWKEKSSEDALIENYLTQAIVLSERNNNDGFTSRAAYNLARFYSLLKNYKKENKLLNKALKINYTLNDDFGIIMCKADLAQNLLNQNIELQTALKLAQEAISEVKKKGEFASKSQIYRVYCNALAANKYSDSVLIYSDSVYFFSEQELKLIFDDRLSEMQTKYETAEKEQKIVVLHKDKQIQLKEITHQKTMRNVFIGGFALMLISASVFLMQRNRISKEKARSEELLLNILPSETAEELKATGSAKAKSYDMVTVLFTDFKNFTQASEKLTAVELVSEINHCYSEFDKIIGNLGIEKIKTIGDSYMCAGGLPATKNSHPIDMINAALQIRDFMSNYKKNFSVVGHNGAAAFEIRIGIHTGPVVAGIVGIKKFAYDIWGDTVNLASRMESSGEIGKVNISGATYELIKDSFICTYRGKIQAKNKGEIDMYFVDRSLPIG